MPNTTEHETHIGVAGWAYKDWEGIVYPADLKKKKQHPVEYLAAYFDVIEINTSFYGHIKPGVAKSWCRYAAANPKFLFTAKLNRAFTHSPVSAVESTSAATIKPGLNDEAEALAGLSVLAEEGKLGALLMQFPISFKNTQENRGYLDGLILRWKEYPLVLEVRHQSWNTEEVLKYLVESGVGICNVDQPLLGRAVRPGSNVTSPLGYVRLHGRNYEKWFTHQHSHERYDYLYSEKELAGWEKRIEQIAENARQTFVIANNHYQGKAAVNALEIKRMLTGKKVQSPPELTKRYPRLASITE